MTILLWTTWCKLSQHEDKKIWITLIMLCKRHDNNALDHLTIAVSTQDKKFWITLSMLCKGRDNNALDNLTHAVSIRDKKSESHYSMLCKVPDNNALDHKQALLSTRHVLHYISKRCHRGLRSSRLHEAICAVQDRKELTATCVSQFGLVVRH